MGKVFREVTLEKNPQVRLWLNIYVWYENFLRIKYDIFR